MSEDNDTDGPNTGRFRGGGAGLDSGGGLEEEEIIEIIEGYREKWMKEDEVTYASKIDTDVAQA